jgi:tetratricopeptide (TPR) repeat protein
MARSSTASGSDQTTQNRASRSFIRAPMLVKPQPIAQQSLRHVLRLRATVPLAMSGARSLAKIFCLISNPEVSSDADAHDQLLKRLDALQKHNRWIVLVSIAILAVAIYLVMELPRATSGGPWTEVSRAMREYDYKHALEVAQPISAAHPNDSYGHEYLGNIYVALGDLARAEAEYSRAYELSAPSLLQQKLERVRARRAQENNGAPSSTPPSPAPND